MNFLILFKGGALYNQCFKHPPFQHSVCHWVSLKWCNMSVEINELNWTCFCFIYKHRLFCLNLFVLIWRIMATNSHWKWWLNIWYSPLFVCFLLSFRLSITQYQYNWCFPGNRPHPGSKTPPFKDNDPRRSFVVKVFDPRVHFALVCGAKVRGNLMSVLEIY